MREQLAQRRIALLALLLGGTSASPPVMSVYAGRMFAVVVRAEVVQEAQVRVCRLSLRGPGLGLHRPLTGWAHQHRGKPAVLAPAIYDALSRRRVNLDMDSLHVNASHLCIDAGLPLGLGVRTVVLSRRATDVSRGFEWPQPAVARRRRSRRDDGL